MDAVTLLIALPIAIAAVNFALALVTTAVRASYRAKLGLMIALLVLTVGASCLGQPDYPGCRKYEELSALWPQTLGNLSYLLLLLLLDVLIVMAPWYVARRKGPQA
jgi:hypothetical protein